MTTETKKPDAPREHAGSKPTLLTGRRNPPTAAMLVGLEPELGRLLPNQVLDMQLRAFAHALLTAARSRRMEGL